MRFDADLPALTVGRAAGESKARPETEHRRAPAVQQRGGDAGLAQQLGCAVQGPAFADAAEVELHPRSTEAHAALGQQLDLAEAATRARGLRPDPRLLTQLLGVEQGTGAGVKGSFGGRVDRGADPQQRVERRRNAHRFAARRVEIQPGQPAVGAEDRKLRLGSANLLQGLGGRGGKQRGLGAVQHQLKAGAHGVEPVEDRFAHRRGGAGQRTRAAWPSSCPGRSPRPGRPTSSGWRGRRRPRPWCPARPS